MVVSTNSSALKDTTKIHSDLLFALRVGLIVYEGVVTMASNWAEKGKSSVNQKASPRGPWFGLFVSFNQMFVLVVFNQMFMNLFIF